MTQQAYTAPERGSLWKHPRIRHRWRVVSAGPKWVTLEATMKLHLGYNRHQVAAESWPRDAGEEWSRV